MSLVEPFAGIKEAFGVTDGDSDAVREVLVSFGPADREIIVKLARGMEACDIANTSCLSLQSIHEIQGDFIQAMIQAFPQAAE